MKRVLILDLDNTIYPVSSVAQCLFNKFFFLLDQEAAIDPSALTRSKDELTRRPFHDVADEFSFSPELRNKGIEILNNLTYDKPIVPFSDYDHIRKTNLDKFLVTTGFTKLQYSKIRQLGIENDFKEINIVDPEVSSKTKVDIFKELMDKYNYPASDILVIGDDPQSEIRAAAALGIDTFLYDPDNKYPGATTTYRGDNLEKVLKII
jgi:putative hydrolase of the HAD superfamily